MIRFSKEVKESLRRSDHYAQFKAESNGGIWSLEAHDRWILANAVRRYRAKIHKIEKQNVTAGK